MVPQIPTLSDRKTKSSYGSKSSALNSDVHFTDRSDICDLFGIHGVLLNRPRARFHPAHFRTQFIPILVLAQTSISSSSMPLSEASLQWLQPVGPPQQPATAPPTSAHNSSGDDENVHPHPPTATPKKRTHVSSVVDVDDMVSSGFVCCNKLRCVESFVLGKGDVATLRAEQSIISSLTGAGRSSFVHTMIPLVDPGRNRGAMLAGRQLVCSAVFRRAFQVSNNMIQAQKGNAGSPALKS